MAANVMEIYGSKVFWGRVMKERVAGGAYRRIEDGVGEGGGVGVGVGGVVGEGVERV